jgi:hypothetical protein
MVPEQSKGQRAEKRTAISRWEIDCCLLEKFYLSAYLSERLNSRQFVTRQKRKHSTPAG